jgi:hypothetical protein
MPPSLIYAAESSNIQDSWIEDLDCAHQRAYFGVSNTGWTSHDHAMEWLDHFDAETIEKARFGQDWRLLLVDGHSSHINLAFCEKAIAKNILICVYPLHTTHRL